MGRWAGDWDAPARPIGVLVGRESSGEVWRFDGLIRGSLIRRLDGLFRWDWRSKEASRRRSMGAVMLLEQNCISLFLSFFFGLAEEEGRRGSSRWR